MNRQGVVMLLLNAGKLGAASLRLLVAVLIMFVSHVPRSHAQTGGFGAPYFALVDSSSFTSSSYASIYEDSRAMLIAEYGPGTPSCPLTSRFQPPIPPNQNSAFLVQMDYSQNSGCPLGSADIWASLIHYAPGKNLGGCSTCDGGNGQAGGLAPLIPPSGLTALLLRAARSWAVCQDATIPTPMARSSGPLNFPSHATVFKKHQEFIFNIRPA